MEGVRQFFGGLWQRLGRRGRGRESSVETVALEHPIIVPDESREIPPGITPQLYRVDPRRAVRRGPYINPDQVGEIDTSERD